MNRWIGAGCVTMVLAIFTGCGGGRVKVASPASTAQKVIIDSDYNTMEDDGLASIMAFQLQAQGTLKIMGITVVTGNDWGEQEVSDALKAVERMGVSTQIGVYASPIHHDCTVNLSDIAAGGGSHSGGSSFVGTVFAGAYALGLVPEPMNGGDDCCSPAALSAVPLSRLRSVSA
jgi:purine nucleosidase